MLRLGLLQEAETLGQRGPTQRRRHYHPQLLVLVTGPRITRWQVNIHFCVKDVFSLREIVPSEQKAMTTHYSPLAWKNPKMERPGGLQSKGLLRVGHD